MYGQPFGAGHAVPNFYRVAEWYSRFLCRYYHIAVDRFFDDFWLVTTQSRSSIGMRCLLETAELFGIVFDADKTQLPSQRTEALGVRFNTVQINTAGLLTVEPKPSRVAKLVSTIDGVLDTDTLTPAQAASLVGKFGFLASTLYGKVGRCAMLALRSRQYSLDSVTGLSPELITSLKLMRIFASEAPPREVRLRAPLPHFLLYTDASDVPERAQRFGVGAVLIDQRVRPQLYHFAQEVDPSTVARWLPKKTYMGQLEIYAGPIALHTWRSMLAGSHLLHFVDNDSASACLVKGYSPRSDSCELVGIYWLTASRNRIASYIDSVESKSNLSDGPSRFDSVLLERLGSEPAIPAVPDMLTLTNVHDWFVSDRPHPVSTPGTGGT